MMMDRVCGLRSVAFGNHRAINSFGESFHKLYAIRRLLITKFAQLTVCVGLRTNKLLANLPIRLILST